MPVLEARNWPFAAEHQRWQPRVSSPIRCASNWFETDARADFGLRQGAPLSMFPVCIQWITPLFACSFHRPLMKTIRSRQGASGVREGPSSMAAPSPLAHQWFEWKPMPVKVTSVRTQLIAGARRRGELQRFEPGQGHGHAEPRSRVRREKVGVGVWRIGVSSREGQGDVAAVVAAGRMQRNCSLRTMTSRTSEQRPPADMVLVSSSTSCRSESCTARPSA